MAVPKSIHKLNFKITPDINDWTPPERSLQNFHFSLLDTSREKEVLDDEEVQAFIEVNKNINTKKTTESDLKIWYKWCNSIGEKRNIGDISPQELNCLLSHFFIKVRRRDGREYEPDTLTSIHRSLDRYLTKDLSKNYSLLNDINFEKSRQTLKAARKSLKQLGKGNRPNAADSITDAEIEKLWSSQALGDHSPKNLQMTIRFCLCIHMGMRGRDEHHKYRFGDFTLKFTSDGHEYVEFTQERGTKTRSGEGEAHQQRAFKPKMFATPACPDRCPVKLFKTFISHRPEGMNLPESPFYLAVNQKLNEHSKWYKCQPLGIHQINGFMKTLSEVAELPGRKTNHSARKTTVQKLCNSGIPDSTVLQVSGHRNVHSLNNYKKPSIEQQQSISHLLSCYSTQPNPSTSIPILSSTYNSTMTDITNQQSQNGGVIMPGCTLHSCTIQIISSPCGPLTKKPKMDSTSP